ncbi:unnamed protein product, partial [marine sediment metagenome]
MANPAFIIADYPDQVAGSSGFDVYALLRRDSDNYIYDEDANQLITIGTFDNTKIRACDIPLVWKNAGNYSVAFPTVDNAAVNNLLAEDDYTVQIRLAASGAGSESISDPIIDSYHVKASLRNVVLKTVVSSVPTPDIVIRLAAGAAIDDIYNNMVVSITDMSAGITATRRAVDYDGTDKDITFDEDFGFSIAAGDTVRIWSDAYSDPAPTSA